MAKKTKVKEKGKIKIKEDKCYKLHVTNERMHLLPYCQMRDEAREEYQIIH